MSLVNDMLRDLETRRAPPAERAPLDGLLPADEGAAARRAGRRRLLLALPLLLALAAAAFLLLRPWADAMPAAAVPAPLSAPPAPAGAPVADGEPPVRLLATLPQHGRERFVLQLLLDRAPEYRRSEQSGVVSLRLARLQLADQGPRAGGFAGDGRSLSWSLLPVDDGAELLLVGLGDELQVLDRLEPAGERWQLWVEVPLVADPFDPEQLPVAAEPSAEPPPVPARPSAPLAAAPAPAPQSAPAAPRVPEVSVASHRPDPLGEARQALLAGERGRAIALLETLVGRQPEHREALRWLARARLADGQTERLLGELPAWLARFPGDGELRVLLARAQLQSGASAAAAATLAERLPPLAEDPAWHALLAATYQQTGQWRDSARLYRNLVLLRPSQANWQLGLGIALERLGDPAGAAQHYRQALQGQGLDDASRRYARERALALGGEP
ncbi:tetratricopeptide repeat protein [Pseudomonas stutzeri]|nr:tetratricopeptide repeat protein [Stutzerimonas stutzeri]